MVFVYEGGLIDGSSGLAAVLTIENQNLGRHRGTSKIVAQISLQRPRLVPRGVMQGTHLDDDDDDDHGNDDDDD